MTVTNTGAVANSGTGTTQSATFGTAPASGELLVAWTVGSSASSAAAGWTAMGQQAAQGTTLFSQLYWKVAGASESTSQTPATQGNNAWRCHINKWSATTGWPSTAGALVLSADNIALGNTTSIVTSSVTPSSGIEAVAICGSRGGNASTFSAEAISGTNVGTVTERTDANASGTWEASITSTSGSYQGTATASISGNSAEFAAIAILSTVVITANSLVPIRYTSRFFNRRRFV